MLTLALLENNKRKLNMVNKQEEIKVLLIYLLKRLQEVEKRIEKQEQDVEIYFKSTSLSYDSKNLLLPQQRSTRISLELLKEVIEELLSSNMVSYAR